MEVKQHRGPAYRAAQRIAMLSLICAAAILCSYVEVFLPLPIPIPGFKLGLSNIVMLLALRRFRLCDTLLIGTVRALTVALLFGGLTSFWFAFCGGTLSILAMKLLLKQEARFSLLGVSVFGATAHNLGQLFAALCVVRSAAVLAYLPFLMVCSLITGLLIGFAVLLAEKKLPRLPAT